MENWEDFEIVLEPLLNVRHALDALQTFNNLILPITDLQIKGVGGTGRQRTC